MHPTAIVSGSARLGAGVTIGPYAVIEGDTVVGDRCTVAAHAVLKRFTQLGVENVVHEGAVLGGEPQDPAYEDCESYLVIGDRNRIRESVTIHRGSRPGSVTRIGSDGYFMAYSHVAHDCTIGDGVTFVSYAALAGGVQVGDRAFLGGGALVHQRCRVGRLAMVQGHGSVSRDCLPFVITAGAYPGRASGINVVGLRRAGLAAGQRLQLQRAYRILVRSGRPVSAALDALRELNDPLVDEIVAFVSSSARGFCGAGKTRSRA